MELYLQTPISVHVVVLNKTQNNCIVHLKRDGTRAETRFRLSPKQTSPFKSAGASVQSTAGSRGVRMSGSNAGYTTFRRNVSSGYPLHSPVSLFTSPPVRHRVPSVFKRTLLQENIEILGTLKQETSLIHVPLSLCLHIYHFYAEPNCHTVQSMVLRPIAC
jgi:hypothetical protein